MNEELIERLADVIAGEDNTADAAIAVLTYLAPLRDDIIDLIIEGTERGHHVYEWPDDEAQAFRDARDKVNPSTGTYNTMEEVDKIIKRFRAGKIADQLLGTETGEPWRRTLEYAAGTLEGSHDPGDLYCARQIRKRLNER